MSEGSSCGFAWMRASSFYSLVEVADVLNSPSSRLLTGGKGTPRRKVARKPKGATGGIDGDKKLQTALKKLQVQPLTGIEEVNMFKDDGNVLHFQGAKGGCSEISGAL